jgi:hypothetical protein
MFLRGKKMRYGFRYLAGVVAICGAMTGGTVTPVFAQTPVATSDTTTTTSTPPVKRRRHILHRGIGSASSRNVGPASSTAGAGTVAGSGTQSGVPSVPGAPGAGNATGSGGK